jgi:CRP/FNR family cyclic AMP-dependent transcriptional regulator
MQRRINILQQVDIFDELPQEHLKKLAAVCREVKHQGLGEVIVRENTPSDELYIIVAGRVDIEVSPEMLLGKASDSPDPTIIATLLPGETFGEIGLVDQGLRSASVRTVTEETLLLAISREDLLRLCEEDHHLGYLLMRNIATEMAFKIRNTDFVVREQLLWRPRFR